MFPAQAQCIYSVECVPADPGEEGHPDVFHVNVRLHEVCRDEERRVTARRGEHEVGEQGEYESPVGDSGRLEAEGADLRRFCLQG
jgi:hypothetical protein